MTGKLDHRAPPRIVTLVQRTPWLTLAAYLLAFVAAMEIPSGSRIGPLLVFAPVGLLAVIRSPRAALVVAIPLLTLDQQLLGGFVTKLLPAIVCLVWGLGLLTGRWNLVPRFHGPLVLLIILILISLVFTTRVYSPLSASSDIVTLVTGVLLCAAAASIRPSVHAVLTTISVVGVVTAIVMVTGVSGAVTHQSDYIEAHGLDRISALGLGPNSLAILLALGGLALIGLAIDHRNPLIAVGLAPIVLALPTIKSRSALLELAAGIVMLLLARRRFKSRVIVVAACAVLLLLAPQVVRTTYDFALGARTRDNLSNADAARRAAARFAVREGYHHPLFGIGYGNFPGTALASDRVGLFVNTHNDYLRLFAEAGLPALVCLIIVFVDALRSTRHAEYGGTALAVLGTYAFALLSADTLSNPAVTGGTWVLLGAVVGNAARRRALVPTPDGA